MHLSDHSLLNWVTWCLHLKTTPGGLCTDVKLSTKSGWQRWEIGDLRSSTDTVKISMKLAQIQRGRMPSAFVSVREEGLSLDSCTTFRFNDQQSPLFKELTVIIPERNHNVRASPFLNIKNFISVL